MTYEHTNNPDDEETTDEQDDSTSTGELVFTNGSGIKFDSVDLEIRGGSGGSSMDDAADAIGYAAREARENIYDAIGSGLQRAHTDPYEGLATYREQMSDPGIKHAEIVTPHIEHLAQKQRIKLDQKLIKAVHLDYEYLYVWDNEQHSVHAMPEKQYFLSNSDEPPEKVPDGVAVEQWYTGEYDTIDSLYRALAELPDPQ